MLCSQAVTFSPSEICFPFFFLAKRKNLKYNEIKTKAIKAICLKWNTDVRDDKPCNHYCHAQVTKLSDFFCHSTLSHQFVWNIQFILNCIQTTLHSWFRADSFNIGHSLLCNSILLPELAVPEKLSKELATEHSSLCHNTKSSWYSWIRLTHTETLYFKYKSLKNIVKSQLFTTNTVRY